MSREPTIDDIWGSKEEYFKLTGLTPQDLLNKTDKEIELLKYRLSLKVEELKITDPLISAIYEALEKKKKSRERYKKWVKN